MEQKNNDQARCFDNQFMIGVFISHIFKKIFPVFILPLVIFNTFKNVMGVF